MKIRSSAATAFLLSLALASAAAAVIIDSGDGTGNTSAPPQDPGWDNVGSKSGLTAVYLGDGWVLTANHVGAGDTVFGATNYPWVPGSDVQLHNPDNSLADLRLFELYPPYPPLPSLAIRTTSPSTLTSLVLIGNGRNRGAATTWNPPGPGPTFDGYLWGPGAAKRWGTNLVEISTYFETGFGTWVFGSVFTQSGGSYTTHEAQAATGDSGGAAFAWNGTSYELAGTLIGIGTFQGQPAETALYMNDTYAADLSIYRDEIVATMPEPGGGVAAGAALVAALPRARRRRVSAPSSPGSARTSGRAR
jgi:hypothetical protein